MGTRRDLDGLAAPGAAQKEEGGMTEMAIVDWRPDVAGLHIEGCAQEGCSGLATHSCYCDECMEQMEALDAWSANERAKREARQLVRLFRRQERVEQWRRTAAWARKWIWAPLVVFGAGCALYLGFVLGAMFLNWIGGR
jgi:hypothetical protein